RCQFLSDPIPRPTQLQARGRYEEAELLYRQALEIRSGLKRAGGVSRVRLGDSHPDTMSSMYNLANLLKTMGQLEEAEQLFREELELCRSVHGAQHKETVSSTRSLAKFLKELGRETEAAEVLAGIS
ncbi:klc-2, partial [Symbiodinium sp. CCMP2456]